MSEPDVAAWTRQQVEARRDLALRATESRPHLRDSEARLAGEWQTGCTCKAKCGECPACEEVTGDGIHIYSEGGHDVDQAALIAANDPQDTIARCEAELAILDACRRGIRNGRAFLAEEIVRLLASGYRHHPGYQEAWKPDKQG